MDSLSIIIFLLIFTCIAFAAGLLFGYTIMQKEAVKKGKAHYVSSPNGNPEWRWI